MGKVRDTIAAGLLADSTNTTPEGAKGSDMGPNASQGNGLDPNLQKGDDKGSVTPSSADVDAKNPSRPSVDMTGAGAAKVGGLTPDDRPSGSTSAAGVEGKLPDMQGPYNEWLQKGGFSMTVRNPSGDGFLTMVPIEALGHGLDANLAKGGRKLSAATVAELTAMREEFNARIAKLLEEDGVDPNAQLVPSGANLQQSLLTPGLATMTGLAPSPAADFGSVFQYFGGQMAEMNKKKEEMEQELANLRKNIDQAGQTPLVPTLFQVPGSNAPAGAGSPDGNGYVSLAEETARGLGVS